MNITGIIAEFNPLHKGHIRLIRHAKNNLDASFVVIAMSGNFMQRGIPALISKYERARHAIAHGADLVIELPVTGATLSAEGFARTGVMTLNATGLVNGLLFGSEHPNMDYFHEAAHLASSSSIDFYKRVNALVKTGMNYAVAREKALTEGNTTNFPADFLSGSNNILGIEYVKTLQQYHLSITPYTIGRDGSIHNSRTLNDNGISSATAIRHAIHIGNTEAATDSLPEDVILSLKQHIRDKEILLMDDISTVLHYALLNNEHFFDYADISEDLSNKIIKTRDCFTTLKQYAELLKTKDLTYTRICRGLLHILLQIKNEDVMDLKSADYAPYLRILDFSKRGAFLLKQMKESAKVPFFLSPNEAAGNLTPLQERLLARDIHASDIYRMLITAKTNRAYPTEYTRKFLHKS